MHPHFSALTADLRREKIPLLLVSLLTLIVHGFLWLAWTPHLGPDGSSYLSYYLDLVHSGDAPINYTNLVYRLPIAPLVQAVPLTISPTVYIITQTIFALVSVICVYLIARAWNQLSASLAALLYTFYLPIQIQFHQVSVDSVYLWGFLLFALALRYTLQNATWRSAIFLGITLGIVALIRPALLLFPLVLLAGLFLPGITWRRRIQMVMMVWLIALLFIAPWIIYKGLRYGDWNYTRGSGWAVFYIVYSNAEIQEEIVRPDNGPASREFADLVETRLLTHPLYQEYQITLDDFFDYRPDGRNFRFFQDAVAINDQVYGYASNNALLRDVSIEAIQSHPVRFMGIMRRSLSTVLFQPPPMQHIPQYNPPLETAVEAPEQVADTATESERIQPSEGELIPHAAYGFWGLRPASVPEASPAAYAEHTRQQAALIARLNQPNNRAIGDLLTRLYNRLWIFTPRILYFLTALALLFSRGRSLVYLLLIGMGAMSTVIVSAALAPYVRYRMEVEPIFVIGAAIGLATMIQALMARRSRDYFGRIVMQ